MMKHKLESNTVESQLTHMSELTDTLWSANLWAIYSYCQECLKHLNGQPVPQILPKQERMGRRAFKM